jgi:Protein of unknown function (DUF2384)
MRTAANPRPATQAAVLTKAALRAAALLGLKDAELARVIGVSAASLSRLHRDRTIAPSTKEGELAVLFVRMYRSLDAVLSGQEKPIRAWFQAENHHLGGVPARLVQTVPGLVHVLQYLDAMRAKN